MVRRGGVEVVVSTTRTSWWFWARSTDSGTILQHFSGCDFGASGKSGGAGVDNKLRVLSSSIFLYNFLGGEKKILNQIISDLSSGSLAHLAAKAGTAQLFEVKCF